MPCLPLGSIKGSWRFPLLCVLLFFLFKPAPTHGAGLNNIPIGDWKEEAFVKVLNWAGYSYPLSTRPWKRRELARILLQIRDDSECDKLFRNRYFRRHYDSLAQALKKEIQEIEEWDNGRIDLDFQALDVLRVEGRVLRSEGEKYYRDLGEICRDCDQGQIWLSHQFQLESYFSAYINESYVRTHSYWDERRERDEREEVFVEEGYAKLQLFNLELEVGREHLWWGPGYDATLMVSDNAPPFDMIKLSNFAPFILPWHFKYLGQINALFFITRLEKERVIPRPYLTGMRVTIHPLGIFEMGATRMIMAGGEGQGKIETLSDVETIISARKEHDAGDKFNLNQLAALDLRVHLPHLRRWTPIQMIDAYMEMGMEMFWYLKVLGRRYYIKPHWLSYLYGIHLDLGRHDLRFEYTDLLSSTFFYDHFIYKSGYTYEGKFIGHHIGGSAYSFYGEAQSWILPQWRCKLFYGWERSFWILARTFTYQRAGVESRYFLTPPSQQARGGVWMMDLAYTYGNLDHRRWEIANYISTIHAGTLNLTLEFP